MSLELDDVREGRLASMRILLTTTEFPPSRGGVQHILWRIAAGIAQEHAVRVVTPNQAQASEWGVGQRFRTVRTCACQWRPLLLVALWLRTVWETFRFRPTVIVCGHVTTVPGGVLGRMIFRVPYVIYAHGSEIHSAKLRRFFGFGLRRAVRVVTGSRFSAETVEATGVPRSRITIIHPGPVHDDVGKSDDVGQVTGRFKTLLSVARLSRHKGHDNIISALPEIRRQVPNLRYNIIGEGELRDELSGLAASLGVSDIVTFADEVSDDKLNSHYRECDVFILANRFDAESGGVEGYGIAFIEANLRGKPVIGGRSGGVEDAVIDGVTGLLVDPLSVEEIAEAAVRLLTDRELAHRLGEQGRRRAAEELSWPRYIAAFERVLTDAVAEAS